MDIDEAVALEAWLWAQGRWKDVLLFLARNKEHGTKNVPKIWFKSVRERGVRRYYCRICGVMMATEAKAFPRTKHARESISAHGADHLYEVQKFITVSGPPQKTFVF